MGWHSNSELLGPLTERELDILRLIADGLSNSEIAQQLVLSLGTVKWYNTQIFDKLGVKNRTQAIARIRELGILGDDNGDAPATTASVRHNLPRHSLPLIGRDDELASLRQLLQDDNCRLLTLVGPGGIGKTHLAVTIAGMLLDRFPDGVYFVALAPLTSPEDIAATIAATLEIPFTDGKDLMRHLLAYVRDRHLLLVLDNFDTLLDGAGMVADLISAAPGLKIMVTSRERLNLQEEILFRVGGIKLPNPANGVDALDNDAVRLFIGRARQAQPDFAPGEQDIAAIAHICQLVEGMPLGIVLAAAWMEILSPAEIAAEITRSLDFLQTQMRDMPERHRSIRGVFESAWQRLSPQERTVFAWLSVFRGGFTREAAQAVAGTTLQTLMALVNKSLLRRDADGRFSIHELLRQYAAEELVRSGDFEAANHAHSQHYLGALSQPPGDDPLNQAEADIDNLRIAWNWAVEHSNYAAIDAALNNLHNFCIRRSRYWDAFKCFNQAIDHAEAHPGEIDPRTILRLRECRGKVRILLGMEEFEGAVNDLTVVCDAAHRMGDFAWERELLVHLGQIYRKTEKHPEAILYLNEVIRFSKSSGNLRAVADALYHLGTVYWDEGDNTNRGAYHQEAIDICHELNLRDIVAVQAYHGMGESLLMSGYPERALEHFRQSLELSREVGDHSYESENLQMVAWSLIGTIGTGDYRRSLDYYQQALQISLGDHLHWHTMCNFIGIGLALGSLGDYEEGLARTREGLRMAESVGLARFRSMGLDALGQHFQDLNLLDKAEALHDEGVNLMRRVESTFWLSRLLANRAIDRIRQGNLDVEDDLLEALDIAMSRGQEFHAVRCLEGLAELYIARRQPDTALRYAGQLLDIAEERNMREMRAQALRWRGEAFMLQGQLAEAEAVLSEAARLSNEVGRLRLIWDVQSALARCYRLLGQDERAAHHESLAEEARARIVANLKGEELRFALSDFMPGQ